MSSEKEKSGPSRDTIELAEGLIQKGKRDEALKLTERLMARYPESAEARALFEKAKSRLSQPQPEFGDDDATRVRPSVLPPNFDNKLQNVRQATPPVPMARPQIHPPGQAASDRPIFASDAPERTQVKADDQIRKQRLRSRLDSEPITFGEKRSNITRSSIEFSRIGKQWTTRLSTYGLLAVLVCALGGGGAWFVRQWQQEKTAETISAQLKLVSEQPTLEMLEDVAKHIASHFKNSEFAWLAQARLLQMAEVDFGATTLPIALSPKAIAYVQKSGRIDGRIVRSYADLKAARLDSCIRRLTLDEEVKMVAEQNAELHHLKSMCWLAKGLLPQAVAEARAALKALPSGARHRAWLATVYLEAQDVRSSVETLDGGPSQSARWQITRARVLYESGRDPVEAQDWVKRVLAKSDPQTNDADRAWAHVLLASVLMTQGQSTQAVENLKAATSLSLPFDPRLRLRLAQLMFSLGKNVQAKAMIASMKPLPWLSEGIHELGAELAIESKDAVMTIHHIEQLPPGPTHDWLLARHKHQVGDREAARPLYVAASQDPKLWLKASIQLGQLFVEQNQHEPARTIVESVLDRVPTEKSALRLMVKIGTHVPMAEEIQKRIKAARHIQKNDGDLLAIESEWLGTQGHWEEAYVRTKEAIKENGSQPILQALLGHAALHTHRLEEAAMALQVALREQPDLAFAEEGMLKLALLKGKPAEAYESLKHLRTLQWDEEAARELVWRVHVMRGSGAEALVGQPLPQTHVEKALLAWLCLQAERTIEAETWFKEVLLVDPHNVEVLVGLARLYVMRSNLGEARAKLNTIASLPKDKKPTGLWNAMAQGLAARLEYEKGDFKKADAKATEALKADGSSDAYLVQALVKLEKGAGALDSLTHAADAPIPLTEAVARLAVELEKQSTKSAKACAWADRYLAMAPNGVDAKTMRAIVSKCSH